MAASLSKLNAMLLGPDAARPIRLIRNQVPRKFLRDHINRWRFGPDAPLSDETVWLPVDRIVWRYRGDTPGAPRFSRQDSGRIVGGDWYKSRYPITAGMKEISCRMRFFEGHAWEDTPIWQHHLDELATGHHPDGARNADELAARFAARDAAFQKIRQDGTLTAMARLPDCFRREHGGVLVHIGPDATYLRSGGGANRFAIARLLNLAYMPVQVGAVHRDAVTSGDYAALHRGPTPPPQMQV